MAFLKIKIFVISSISGKANEIMGQVINLTLFDERQPRCVSKQPVTTLKDLYFSLGKNKAYERYGHCWNLFPTAFTAKDLDGIGDAVRTHIKAGSAAVLIIEKQPDSRIVYKNLDKAKLVNMLRCIYSLRRELIYQKDM